jgi:hypothetical protein
MKLMSDTRHEQLIKAAEHTLELMGAGVEPTAALYKVAKDEGLNKNEVQLVSSAVNNSKTIATLQTREPEDRAKPFPLTNAETVVNELFPEMKEELSDDAKQRQGKDDHPAAKTPNAKEAQDSYYDFNRYDFSPEDEILTYRAKVAEAKVAAKPDLEANRIQLEEARIGWTAARDAAETSLSKVAHAFRLADAPAFERFEKICNHAGVTPELVDMVYTLGNLASVGCRRAGQMTKEASTIRALPNEYRLLQEIVRADEMWKQAADYLAVRMILEDKNQADTREVFQLKEAKDTDDSGVEVTMKVDPSEGWRGSFDNIVSEGITGGTMPEDVMRAAGLHGEGATAPKSPLEVNARQQLQNIQARESLENVMQDPFIGKHPLPQVIDAYNRAISVKPSFGAAELASYIRQDLATEGGVPLDLQLRASKGKGDRNELG